MQTYRHHFPEYTHFATMYLTLVSKGFNLIQSPSSSAQVQHRKTRHPLTDSLMDSSTHPMCTWKDLHINILCTQTLITYFSIFFWLYIWSLKKREYHKHKGDVKTHVYLLENNWLCFENINDCIIKLFKGRTTSFWMFNAKCFKMFFK